MTLVCTGLFTHCEKEQEKWSEGQKLETQEARWSLLVVSHFLRNSRHSELCCSKRCYSRRCARYGVEFAKYGILAYIIASGFIKTGMTHEQVELSGIDKHMILNIPMGRPGYPADFEAIAVYLCSDASSFHIGDTIVIDGGDHIK